jgi:spore coat polysaccharide biosynthesis protein SpsF
MVSDISSEKYAGTIHLSQFIQSKIISKIISYYFFFKSMKIVAIVQARLGSKRFPRKVFANLAGKPMIWHLIERLKYSREINKIILATTDNQLDDDLSKWAETENVLCFRGSENNLLQRFYFTAKHYEADIIARVTADDPFKDPEIIDYLINVLLANDYDFVCNNNPPSFPEGLDTEIFTYKSLERAYSESIDDYEKEHMTQYFYRNPDKFSQYNFLNSENLSHLRWTVDTIADFEFANIIYSNLYRPGSIFLMNEIIDFLKRNPEIIQTNANVERSAMYKK